jgi:predicted nucleotidyltransferase
MRLEHYPLKKLKKEILGICGKYLDLKQYKVFFFGSRVSDAGDDRSDIDVGILGPEPVFSITKIREEVENLPILYKIDVVDFKDTSEGFRKVALEDIELIKAKS